MARWWFARHVCLDSRLFIDPVSLLRFSWKRYSELTQSSHTERFHIMRLGQLLHVEHPFEVELRHVVLESHHDFQAVQLVLLISFGWKESVVIFWSLSNKHTVVMHFGANFRLYSIGKSYAIPLKMAHWSRNTVAVFVPLVLAVGIDQFWLEYPSIFTVMSCVPFSAICSSPIMSMTTNSSSQALENKSNLRWFLISSESTVQDIHCQIVV